MVRPAGERAGAPAWLDPRFDSAPEYFARAEGESREPGGADVGGQVLALVQPDPPGAAPPPGLLRAAVRLPLGTRRRPGL
eukprot:1536615-Pyramimonas_sp.AAC.1